MYPLRVGMPSSLLLLSLFLLSLAQSIRAASTVEDEWNNVRAHDELEQSVHKSANAIQEQINQLKENVESVAAELNNTMRHTSNTVENHVDDNSRACSSDVQCNTRGTCMGTYASYICFCNLGFSGKNCQDTVCDSARDCNGRGLCLGTISELTCLCNLGYAGKHCERKA